jgi:hypothetical protein
VASDKPAAASQVTRETSLCSADPSSLAPAMAGSSQTGCGGKREVGGASGVGTAMRFYNGWGWRAHQQIPM